MATGGNSSSFTSAIQPTKLDQSKDSLSLSILQALDDPMTEEQAWAIFYQSAKTALQCFTSGDPLSPPPTTSRHNNNDNQSHQQHANNNIHNLTDKSENEVMMCFVVKSPSDLWIHRDGHVLPHSFQEADEWRTVAERESQLVSGLAVAIYLALDFCCGQEDKSRNLSPELSKMLNFFMLADKGQSIGLDDAFLGDKGIELDSGEAEDSAAAAAAASVSSTSTTSSASTSPAAAAAAAASGTKSLSHVMDVCRMHFSSSTGLLDEEDFLSKRICQDLVAETFGSLELLDIISSAAAPPEAHPPPRPTPPAPPEAPTAAWTKNMMQVIPQLRNGVKLNSASGGESARKPNEYELTLLDDIRLKRCKLRQVMVDGTPPRVKKDANTLELIRSRPPLRKESEWKQLKPRPPPEKFPIELLMESIRQHDSKELKPKRRLLVITLSLKERKKRTLERCAFANELQRQKEDCEQKSVARANLEKQTLVEQNELVVQRLKQENNVLQERLEEETRQKEETTNRLARIERCWQELQHLLGEERLTNGRRRSASVPEPAIALDPVPVPHAGIFQAAEPPDTPRPSFHGESGNSFKRIRLIKRRYFGYYCKSPSPNGKKTLSFVWKDKYVTTLRLLKLLELKFLNRV